jgi:hypothetical protein
MLEYKKNMVAEVIYFSVDRSIPESAERGAALRVSFPCSISKDGLVTGNPVLGVRRRLPRRSSYL